MKKVLIIEDDKEIVELLSIHLADLNCDLDKSLDGKKGLEMALEGDYDLIVLDLMLPRMDGMEMCRRLRAKEIHSPIMMLTAKSEEVDKILGLEMGADDYLTKPFSVREFVARVKAIFRRMEMKSTAITSEKSLAKMDFGELVIDPDKRKVTIREKRVELSPKEFELLSLLASNPGKSYDREKILTLVWGYDFDGFAHTVNSHINRLRAKIEPNIHKPTYILTSWGVGYRFNEDL